MAARLVDAVAALLVGPVYATERVSEGVRKVELVLVNEAYQNSSR